MSNKIYILTTIILLALAGWIFFGGGIAASKSSDSSSSSTDSGDYQKVVLSMKNGNYYPNTVNVEAGKKVRVYLDKSVGGCYRSFNIRSFGVSSYLKTPSDYVEFTPTKAGNYGFACSMGMGRGTIVVK
ncbi:MAG TPA: cupredoxin domain-containing protein [Candidatus Nanoarchaeia archaeon]|nr:cupredoxin domain-containing protein [Candidatus Nanoarchaeia archaeon]